MARKRHSDEDVLKLLREIEVHLASGCDVATACRSAGISDATYYNWRKRFGGITGVLFVSHTDPAETFVFCHCVYKRIDGIANNAKDVMRTRFGEHVKQAFRYALSHNASFSTLLVQRHRL